MLKNFVKVFVLAAFLVATMQISALAASKVVFINKTDYDIEGFYFVSKARGFSGMASRDIPKGSSAEIDWDDVDYFDIMLANTDYSPSFSKCTFPNVSKITIAKVTFVNKTGDEIESIYLKNNSGNWNSSEDEIADGQSRDIVLLPGLQNSIEIYLNDDTFSFNCDFSNTTQVIIAKKGSKYYLEKR
ncbi:MAG: hypothetical protein IKO74_06615 [Selenomonadaceae bacterium]|nr:hypothetical protein [Selenomonadaceae bacterium]